MTLRLALTVALVVAGVTIATALASRRTHSDPSGPSPRLNTISNDGTPFSSLLPADQRALERMGRSHVTTRRLGAIGDSAYYKLTTETGVCYAAGPAVPVTYVFGGIDCPHDFPSAEQPFLDFTVMHGLFAGGKVSGGVVWRSEGIASDGVRSVAFRNADGQLVGETATKDKAYHSAAIPAGTLVAVVALDPSGDAVASQRLAGSR